MKCLNVKLGYEGVDRCGILTFCSTPIHCYSASKYCCRVGTCLHGRKALVYTHLSRTLCYLRSESCENMCERTKINVTFVCMLLGEILSLLECPCPSPFLPVIVLT